MRGVLFVSRRMEDVIICSVSQIPSGGDGGSRLMSDRFEMFESILLSLYGCA